MINDKTDDLSLQNLAPNTSDELIVEDLEERLTQGGVDCGCTSTTCNCTCTCCWYSF